MVYVADETLERILKEDVPHLDLTTWLLDIKSQKGSIRYFSREKMVLCGSEEAERICAKLKLEVVSMIPSGTLIEPDKVFFEAHGEAGGLHMAWKALMGIFEHCSAIATRTRRFVELAKQVNPGISVVTTRKNAPGTKELSIKAILAGGALPHRLGLSETVLIFKQHCAFLGDDDALLNMLPTIKARACEKKIFAEAESISFAIRLCKAGFDGIQFDKVAATELYRYVMELRALNPKIIILAAGGINDVSDYAATGVDAIVTTAVYMGKPVDIGCKMERFR